MVSELVDKSTAHLWLTRRLLALMAPHVEAWLQEHAPAAAPPDRTEPAGKKSNSPAKPVSKKHDPADEEVLVTNIDLSSSPSHLTLVFRTNDKRATRYVLRLQPQQMLPWWQGVHQTCELGGWSLAGPSSASAATNNAATVTIH